ncbi:helix-turn-helix domain-containing protein [[Clostridium] scindens]|uniref:helix-turn-helix domain-containing protein n=1 Tax=Clostridium scindens (strain JCM 10418 / VPI 12708) TaxID=29347 RepID=UPI002ED578C7
MYSDNSACRLPHSRQAENRIFQLLLHHRLPRSADPQHRSKEAFLAKTRSMLQTSEKLFLHKNTLQYKLDRIHRISGFEYTIPG